MGHDIKYTCTKCGYKTEASTGDSGISTKYILPYVCRNSKDLVFINGNSPYIGVGATFSRAPKPSKEEIYPKWPCCPECKDHALDDIWDEETCPKCGKQNDPEITGYWD